MKLVFASHNDGKINEMRKILQGLSWEILSAKEAGVMEDPVEDQDTFTGNALLKARFVAKRTGEWTVADDSGLCVLALDGAPGVFSARWAGENATGEEKAEKVLRELGDLADEKRGAYFETALALISPDGEERIFTGRINGKITRERQQELVSRPKLPYDVVFKPEGFDKTFSQMTDEEKNSLSPRGQAFRALKEFLSNVGNSDR